MIKALITSENETQEITQRFHQNVDYATIADRLWSNCRYPTGVVKLVYGIPTFQLTAKICVIKRTHIKVSLCVFVEVTV